MEVSLLQWPCCTDRLEAELPLYPRAAQMTGAVTGIPRVRKRFGMAPLGIMPCMTLPIARQGSAAGRIPKGGSGCGLESRRSCDRRGGIEPLSVRGRCRTARSFCPSSFMQFIHCPAGHCEAMSPEGWSRRGLGGDGRSSVARQSCRGARWRAKPRSCPPPRDCPSCVAWRCARAGASLVRHWFRHNGERVCASVRDGVAAAAGVVGAIHCPLSGSCLRQNPVGQWAGHCEA